MATKFKSVLLIATIICAIFIALSSSAEEDKKTGKGGETNIRPDCRQLRSKAQREKLSESEQDMLIKCRIDGDNTPEELDRMHMKAHPERLGPPSKKY
jgi:hypothetical protein